VSPSRHAGPNARVGKRRTDTAPRGDAVDRRADGNLAARKVAHRKER